MVVHDRILDAILRYSPVVIGIATVFNIFLLIFFSNRPLSTKEYNVHELEQRSVYIGFDKLYSKPSTATYEPITNYPLFVSSVSFSEPQKVFPLWDYRKLSSLGYLPLAENPLRLTPEVCFHENLRTRLYLSLRRFLQSLNSKCATMEWRNVRGSECERKLGEYDRCLDGCCCCWW